MSSAINNEGNPTGTAQRLTPIEIGALRLRGQKQRLERDDYHPDTNLFSIMFEAGSDWAEYYVTKNYGNQSVYSEEKLAKTTQRIAIDMTRTIQKEYDISLKDKELGQMYGFSHDLATLALGYAIATPVKERKNAPKSPIMRRKRIRQYSAVPSGVGAQE